MKPLMIAGVQHGGQVGLARVCSVVDSAGIALTVSLLLLLLLLLLQSFCNLLRFVHGDAYVVCRRFLIPERSLLYIAR